MYGAPDLWDAADAAAGRHHRGLPAGAGRGRGERRAAVRLVGRARCRRPTTSAACSRTRPPCWRRSASSACRGSTSASAPASCSALMGEAGAEVVGVDFRLPLDEATRRVGPGPRPAGQPRPGRRVRALGRRGRADPRRAGGRPGRPGHIFNLGHGVIPETDPDVLTRIVELVHAESQPAVADRRTASGVGGGRRAGVGCGAGTARASAAVRRRAAAVTREAAPGRPSTVRATSGWRRTRPSRRAGRTGSRGRPRPSSAAAAAVRRDQRDLDGGQVGDVLELGELRLQRLEVGLAAGQLGLDLHDLADRSPPGRAAPGPGRRCAAATGPGCRRR